MEIFGIILMAVGGIACLVYGIQLLILAFQTSVLWGLGYLFIPFVSLIFVIMNWDRTSSPFLKGIVATIIYVVGIVVAGMNSGAVA